MSCVSRPLTYISDITDLMVEKILKTQSKKPPASHLKENNARTVTFMRKAFVWLLIVISLKIQKKDVCMMLERFY
jgi:hypothetical protein